MSSGVPCSATSCATWWYENRQGAKGIEAVSDDGEHAAVAARGDILLEESHAKAWLPPHAARVGSHLARDQAEQRGLAFAVTPDEAHTLARLEPERRGVEQGAVAECHRHAVEFD